MRIAYFVHFYPPSPCGGAGYYTASLAEAFSRAGAEVGVLCVDRWGEGPRYLNGSVDEDRNGVFVRRLHVNWQKAPRPFDWLYDSPILGDQAAAFLDEFQPDIVHVSSCYTLSARPVFVSKERGLPVVMHLHDYWTICARHTLLHKDDTQCSGPESAWKCQKCLLQGSKAWEVSSPFLGDNFRRLLFGNLAHSSWITRQKGLRGMLGHLERRRQVVLQAATVADVLITPSEFTRRLHETYGVRNGSFMVMANGHAIEWAGKVHRSASTELRVGFLGNVTPIKGVHVLVHAYKLLLEQRLPVQLQIWGDPGLAPRYCASLRESAPQAVLWQGRYDKERLPSILSDIDVLVVPSLWYEVQPLVIQEAFAAKVPVIVSDDTSMTEAVIPEQNGLHFRRGDVQDLFRQLNRLIEDPALLEHLRRGIGEVRRIEEDVRDLSSVYTDLLNGRSVGRTGYAEP